ncbi:MAG: N-acetylglucosamine kinase [Rhizobiales bacterium]|nr:N-acetylglucosamine kinase [Hyphomicrobiales bacterium]
MPRFLFLGVDGGGTNCRARIRDDAGALLGEGTGGPANVLLDSRLVMSSILTASRAAAAQAGLAEADLGRAYAGLGVAGAGIKSAVARLLAEPHPFRSVAVETDAHAAWLGAHGGADGAILILGTGSCGLAVVGGRQSYVSGWGAQVSDEASGLMIGREALRRTLWAYDGRAETTPLADAILSRFGGSAEEIVAFAANARPADFGRLVPLVLEHAASRDPLALALVSEATADAARMITRLLDAGAPSVCLLGGLAGVLEAWLPPPLRERLTSPKGDAMDGAILLARQAQAAPAPRPASAAVA